MFIEKFLCFVAVYTVNLFNVNIIHIDRRLKGILVSAGFVQDPSTIVERYGKFGKIWQFCEESLSKSLQSPPRKSTNPGAVATLGILVVRLAEM